MEPFQVRGWSLGEAPSKTACSVPSSYTTEVDPPYTGLFPNFLPLQGMRNSSGCPPPPKKIYLLKSASQAGKMGRGLGHGRGAGNSPLLLDHPSIASSPSRGIRRPGRAGLMHFPPPANPWILPPRLGKEHHWSCTLSFPQINVPQRCHSPPGH